MIQAFLKNSTQLFKILLICFVITACTEQKSIHKIVPSKPYTEIQKDLKTQRKALSAKYKLANEQEKKQILKETKTYLFSVLTTEVFPSWYGTPWDFNGTTTTPNQGKIACGYFVTTTLQHAGFDVPRIKWAQMASENMIKAATPHITRYSNVAIQEVATWLSKEQNELYIVGLDNHTGFVCNKKGTLTFIHSSPYNAAHGVISESIFGSNPLAASKYRVFGKILHKEMLIKWLTAT